MPLKFFEPEESNSNGSLDFLNDWLVENPKNKQKEFLITEVKRVQSNKGFIVSTEKFNVFMWKNAKLTKMLVEALDHYINQSKFGFELYVVLKSPTKAEFSIAANDESRITWFSSKNGYTTSGENATSLEEVVTTGNPLIPPIP